MEPELLGDAVVALAIVAGYLTVLCVGCIVADYVLPHIPFIERFLDRLPGAEGEDDE